MAASSSRSSSSVALLTGEPPADQESTVAAAFRTGANGAEDGAAEYVITNGGTKPLAQGRLTWDPTHAAVTTSALHSVALVRFQLLPGVCRWSVGTSPFIECVPGQYTGIDKVQIVAAVRRDSAHRVVQWDSAEVTFHFGDGRSE